MTTRDVDGAMRGLSFDLRGSEGMASTGGPLERPGANEGVE